ncbi:hypothetical protein [Chitinophaga rhizosphaerae]|uniref:hypothetical protein n=1 Tax=Chitinophaga rhizosphaerae TaxID=1864947 RepID=UPI000F80B90D|nr:hypothetical protein [Chitinophaga rhizosphaerae]
MKLPDIPRLRKVLLADAFIGGVTGVAGLALYGWWSRFLGLPERLVLLIAAVTGLYALMAMSLVVMKPIRARPVRWLVIANWIWAAVSVGMLWHYGGGATVFGKMFLVLQIIVVGGLAWLEGRHIGKNADEV